MSPALRSVFGGWGCPVRVVNNLLMLYSLAIVVALIFLSAVFSSSETAFTALNRVSLEKKAEFEPWVRRILQNLQNPRRYLATVLVGNNIVNIAAAMLVSAIAIEYWGEEYVGIAGVILTAVILIFSEILPKSIATVYPEQISRALSPLIRVVYWLFWPLIQFSALVAKLIFVVFRIPGKRAVWAPTEDELKYIFDRSEASGALDRELGSMLDAVLDLDDVTAGRVMVPRNKVLRLGLQQDSKEVQLLLQESGHSRLPVYQDDTDQVVGFLHAQDFFRWLALHNEQGRWQTLVRSMSFHLKETPVNEILRRMRANDARIAGIVDEYGSFEGIVTLEDILQEVMYSHEASQKLPVVRRLDGSLEFSGGAGLLDVARISGLDFGNDEAETIGGFVAQHGAHIRGDRVEDEAGKWSIEVLAGDISRIRSVRIVPKLVAKEDDTTSYSG